jgi:hypothetical protein
VIVAGIGISCCLTVCRITGEKRKRKKEKEEKRSAGRIRNKMHTSW